MLAFRYDGDKLIRFEANSLTVYLPVSEREARRAWEMDGARAFGLLSATTRLDAHHFHDGARTVRLYLPAGERPTKRHRHDVAEAVAMVDAVAFRYDGDDDLTRCEYCGDSIAVQVEALDPYEAPTTEPLHAHRLSTADRRAVYLYLSPGQRPTEQHASAIRAYLACEAAERAADVA